MFDRLAKCGEFCRSRKLDAVRSRLSLNFGATNKRYSASVSGA
jgi:hypothetical protein